jgi:hypothetical protein
MSAATKLLDRLERVKQTAPGRWLARCPAHEDRRLLLHDFGGCEVGDVLAAVGLELRDLFEKPLGNRPAVRSKIPARDLLEILSEEITLAGIIAADFLAQRSISESEWRRLARAAARIGAARDHLRG